MIWSDIFGQEDEIVFAGRNDDVLSSFHGNDTIFARGGDDLIFLGDRPGTVHVFGGRGEDTLVIAGNGVIEQNGNVTIITTDEGMTVVVRGVEHIDWVM